jgi:putative ABC transport system permease protein
MRRSFALLEHAVGALARRPGKTLALVLSLALVSGMLASILFVHDALEREAASLVRSMPELTVQSIRGGRP